jgi:hypothetical protein
MLEPKERKPVIPPPLWVREKILKKYYNDVQKIGYIDAYIAYDTAMHFAYCQLNPHLKYSGKNKDGTPKLRKLLTRQNFEPHHDQFGFPLWIYKLDEEELNSHLTREEINRKRKAERRPLV